MFTLYTMRAKPINAAIYNFYLIVTEQLGVLFFHNADIDEFLSSDTL
jgi:hypothetical protein